MNPEKPGPREQKILVYLRCLFLLLLTGCQTTNSNFSRIINEPEPLPAALRASFGKVGVLPQSALPDPEIPKPLTTAESMGLIAAGTLVGFHKTVNSDNNYRAIPFELIFGPPLAVTAGVFGGLITGVPKFQQDAAEAAIRKAIREEPLEKGLQAKIHIRAGERQRKSLVPIDESVAVTLKGQNLTNYQAFAATGVDSVLLVRMRNHRFEAADGINPGMAFAVEAHIRVIRVSDGNVLVRSQLAYRSQERSLVEWGQNDAKFLRSELEGARNLLAEMILEQYFGFAEK